MLPLPPRRILIWRIMAIRNKLVLGKAIVSIWRTCKRFFLNVFNCTKDSGTLWVVIDAFRKDGKVIPLPFDFANKIASCGWGLKEIIIWEKDKTVPWAHKGQMRSLFEYILVFSKSDNYKFHIDRVREYGALKNGGLNILKDIIRKGKRQRQYGVSQFQYKDHGGITIFATFVLFLKI